MVIIKRKINQALKLFSKRKSSGIPTNLQTYVILFHGIAKTIPWGDDNQQKQQGSTIVNEELFNRVEKIFKNWRLELAPILLLLLLLLLLKRFQLKYLMHV